MRLTILGSGNVFSGAERYGSGYLLESSSNAIVFDLGFGAFMNLRKVIAPEKISAIFFSHLVHVDHSMDLIAFLENRYSFTKSRNQQKKQINLFGPKGLKQFYGRILELYPSFKQMPFPVKLKEMDYAEKKIFGFTVKSKPVKHVEHTIGYRVESAEGVFVYGADSDYCSELVDLGKDADLFVLEASLGKEKSNDTHMTISEAAEIAAEANAHKLLLTHIDIEMAEKEIKEIAEEKFSGEILIAKDLMQVNI